MFGSGIVQTGITTVCPGQAEGAYKHMATTRHLPYMEFQ